MALPYDQQFVNIALRAMSDERLATIHFHAFQMAPVPVVLPGKVLREMIDNERARRLRNAC